MALEKEIEYWDKTHKHHQDENSGGTLNKVKAELNLEYVN